MIIFGMIGELDYAFCSPHIFCTRSQRVAALVSQIQITVRRASLSSSDHQEILLFWPPGEAQIELCSVMSFVLVC